MATEYIGLPGDLIEKVKAAAAKEEIIPEEHVRDAVEKRLNARGLEDVLAFGKRHARARGLRPSDVGKAIANVRRENR